MCVNAATGRASERRQGHFLFVPAIYTSKQQGYRAVENINCNYELLNLDFPIQPSHRWAGNGKTDSRRPS